jgi:hypothetical protein
MQAQATLPACKTTISAADLAVNLLGCSHFKQAQHESVAQRCWNTGQGEGCVGSCTEQGTCVHAAERFVDTIGAVGGSIPIIGGSIQTAAKLAQYGLHKLERWEAPISKAYGWLKDHLGRRRLQGDDCNGKLPSVACQQLMRVRQKLEAVRGLVATMTSLAEINTKLLSSDKIDVAKLAKLDMSFLDLDLLNDQVLVDSFRHAFGANFAHFELDIKQLVTLIRSKLDQIRSFYKAALEKHGYEQQRDLLQRRAERAQQLVHAESSEAKQEQVAEKHIDAKIKSYAHLELQYLFEQIRAYEYTFLTRYSGGPDLHQLRKAKMNGLQLHKFATGAQVALDKAFTSAAEDADTVQQCFSSTTVQLSSLPAAVQAFRTHGQITVSIPLPADSRYYGVTFAEARVFLVGLPPPSSRDTVVKIRATKTGTSSFLDKHGQPLRFTHKDKSIEFNYKGGKNEHCEAVSESDPLKLSSNIKDWGLRYSPYGVWNVQVENPLSELRLSDVTALRFEFHLDWLSRPHQSGGRSVFFNTTGCTGELKERACTDKSTAGPAAPPPPPPPPTTTKCTSCTSTPEFSLCSATVSKMCCEETGDNCVHGQPQTCDDDCAVALRPMVAACTTGQGLLASNPGDIFHKQTTPVSIVQVDVDAVHQQNTARCRRPS